MDNQFADDLREEMAERRAVDAELKARLERKREREAAAMRCVMTEDALRADLTAGLLVFRTRDGVPLSDEAILERVNNLLAGILGNYKIERVGT